MRIGNIALMATRRLTVSLPEELVRAIDRRSSNRSAYLQRAAKHELERELRRDLERSLSSPVVDEIADAGFEEWLVAIPGDGREIADPDQGTPVRWIEGRGWQ